MDTQVDRLPEPRYSAVYDSRKADVCNRALVVIPVHEALADTISCLESLLRQRGPATEVLIVDNGSSDATVDEIRLQFPHVEMIRQPNLGYSAAANVGIAESQKRGYKYTWLLNSDTVVTAGALYELITFMEEPINDRVGACSPIIFSSHNPPVIQFAGGLLNRSNWSVQHINDPHRGDLQLRNNPHSSFLTGCALLVRNDAAFEVGMFDERFFLYWEDCEFCIRLVEHNWQLRIVPSVSVLHKVQGSSRGQSTVVTYYGSRNCFLLWRLYTKGLRQRMATCPRMLQWIVKKSIGRRATPVTETKRAAIEGIIDGFRGRYGLKNGSLSKTAAAVLGLMLWYVVLPWRLMSNYSGDDPIHFSN